MRHVYVAVVAVLIAVPVWADDKIDVGRAVEQAKTVAKAVLDEDYGKVADLTHPKVVDIMGGREKMIEQTKAVMKALKDQGIEIKSHTVGKAGEPVIDGKTAYLVIPTSLVLTANGMKIGTESYLLGMTTDRGKSWVFVDGAGMDRPEIRDKVFPSLPEGLKLPEKKPPSIIKD
jgi:hypothetical protein